MRMLQILAFVSVVYSMSFAEILYSGARTSDASMEKLQARDSTQNKASADDSAPRTLTGCLKKEKNGFVLLDGDSKTIIHSKVKLDAHVEHRVKVRGKNSVGSEGGTPGFAAEKVEDLASSCQD